MFPGIVDCAANASPSLGQILLDTGLNITWIDIVAGTRARCYLQNARACSIPAPEVAGCRLLNHRAQQREDRTISDILDITSRANRKLHILLLVLIWRNTLDSQVPRF